MFHYLYQQNCEKRLQYDDFAFSFGKQEMGESKYCRTKSRQNKNTALMFEQMFIVAPY